MPKILRNQAFLCSLLLAACVIACWPIAETGMHDDWSYIRTAQVFANTGHIVFNGWGAPMLGIQLLPAALLMKVFGFSFSIARLTTVLLCLLTTALLQRTLVRCGVGDWNASIATITLMLSPMVLPVITGYLSDMWCLSAIVVCLYCCLRALAAETDKASAAWLCTAALANAIMGTSRQIAWLGVLVMVPCAAWLLRSRRKIVIMSALVYLASFAFILFSISLFNKQPYTLAEHFSRREIVLRHPYSVIVRPVLELSLLVLPVLLMFVPAVRRSRRKGQLVAGCIFLVLSGYLAILQFRGAPFDFTIPFTTEVGCIFGPKGVYYTWPIWGNRPTVLPHWVRIAFAGLTALSLLAWIALTVGSRDSAVPRRESVRGASVSLRDLTMLLGPFAFFYVVLLTPRASRNTLIDRYLIPLVMVALVFLIRQYQDRVRPKLPTASLVLALLIAGYSVLTLQDTFAAYRAVLRAGNEVTAAGVPRKEFDGGWEYDGLTQVDEGGYVHQTGIRVPNGPLLYGHRRRGPCEIGFDVWIPDVEPAYALSYDREGCGGATAFAPVSYRRLLWPHTMTIYVVKDPDLSGKHGRFLSF